MVSPPNFVYPTHGNPDEFRNFYPFEMYTPYPPQPERVHYPYNPPYSHLGEHAPYRPVYHNLSLDPPPYLQPESRHHLPYNCPPPAHFPSRPSPPGSDYPGAPIHPDPTTLPYPPPSPPPAPKEEPEQSPQNITNTTTASSPMATPPIAGKQPRNKGRKSSANGHPVKRVTHARYTLLKGRIRNTFCQRKSRKISKAKIASSDIKDKRLKQFYARMIVEKTAKEEEDRSSINKDMDAVARLEFNLQREIRYSTKCLSLAQELMDAISMENERLKREEATISRQEQDQMREKLMGFKNTHTIIDGNGTNDVEDSDKDDEDMENEDSDANSSLGTA